MCCGVQARIAHINAARAGRRIVCAHSRVIARAPALSGSRWHCGLLQKAASGRRVAGQRAPMARICAARARAGGRGGGEEGACRTPCVGTSRWCCSSTKGLPAGRDCPLANNIHRNSTRNLIPEFVRGGLRGKSPVERIEDDMRVPTMGVLGLALLAALVAVGACGVRDCAVRESGRVHAPESPVGDVWRAEEVKAPKMEWSAPQWKAEEAMGPWIRGRATWIQSFSTEATSPGVCRRALRTCASSSRRRRQVLVL